MINFLVVFMLKPVKSGTNAERMSECVLKTEIKAHYELFWSLFFFTYFVFVLFFLHLFIILYLIRQFKSANKYIIHVPRLLLAHYDTYVILFFSSINGISSQFLCLKKPKQNKTNYKIIAFGISQQKKSEQLPTQKTKWFKSKWKI